MNDGWYAKSFAGDSDGKTYTRTYVFPSDVVHQSANPPGFPAAWQSAAGQTVPADYQFDPEVAADPQYVGGLSDSLLGLRTLSLVVDPAELFGTTSGIYANPRAVGDAWDRPFPDGCFDAGLSNG